MTNQIECLGSYNLFTSRFVFGCELPSHNQLDCVEALQDWIDIKDGVYIDSKYNTNKTRYLDFLHIIELPILERVLYDLLKIYRVKYPYAEKHDFIEQVFGHTIFCFEKFIEYDDYTSYGHRNLRFPFEIYFEKVGYTPEYPEYVDYAIDQSKTIKYYKQYYKKVLELIENIDFDGFGNLGIQEKARTNTVFEPIIDYSDRINLNPNNLLDNLNSDTSQIENTAHNDIFKRNAFVVWQSMWDSFAIKKSSRTDIRFMFDTMLKDGLIHKGTTQKRLLDWINDTYEITMGKLPYKNFKNDTKRNAIYASAKAH